MSEDLDNFLKVWSEPAERVVAGTQVFTGEKLFLSDPLDMTQTPLTTATPVGAFAVVVMQKHWTYHHMQPPMHVNAFLVVEFSARPTVRWEQVEAEKPVSGFATDFSAEFGWMAIMDADMRAKVLAKSASVDNAWDDWLAGHFPENLRNDDFAFVPLADGGGFVVCGPGKGNGTYPAFLGRDEDGQATQLVIDFCVRQAT